MGRGVLASAYMMPRLAARTAEAGVHSHAGDSFLTMPQVLHDDRTSVQLSYVNQLEPTTCTFTASSKTKHNRSWTVTRLLT